jgi:hypothetical protein
MNHIDEISFGQLGCKLSTGTEVAAPSGKTIVAITVLAADQTITADSEDTDLWPDLVTLPVPQGVTIYGRFTNILTASANGAIYYFG